MREQHPSTGKTLAAAAAVLFAATALSGCGSTGVKSASSDATPGHCAGVNACKGKSSCATAHNSCKGQNACKGQGFVVLTKQTCDQVGGHFTRS